MSTSFNDLNLQILQNVARFVGFKDVATYSVINHDTSAATRQVFGQLKAEVSELDTTFGTNRSSYYGEARCLHGLRAAGWTIQRWENVSEQVRSSFGLADLKPDAVRLDIGPVVVDFFRIKISTGNPKADAQTREQQRLDSVPSSINSLVNNASRKFSKVQREGLRCRRLLRPSGSGAVRGLHQLLRAGGAEEDLAQGRHRVVRQRHGGPGCLPSGVAFRPLQPTRRHGGAPPWAARSGAPPPVSAPV